MAINLIGAYRTAEYRYNGQNRMAYSDTVDRIGNDRIISEYDYDGFGRRTIVQDTGYEAMRTVYDGLSFEVLREGVTFRDGSLTTKLTTGIVRTEERTPGIRYRYLGPESQNGQLQTRRLSETTSSLATRFTGINATLYGNGEAVAVNRLGNAEVRGGASYLGKDALGSVRSRSNEDGQLEDRYEYDAFGKPYKGDLNSGMNLGYTGKPYDTTTGMYNYGYRDYQPEMARFTTVDPIRDGSNWFAYVNNDPVNYIDLWGLDSMYSTYIQGSGKIVSTYVPNKPDGSIDYENIKTYSFSASNNVSTKINTTILEDGTGGEYYYPQTFPTGTWKIGESRQVSPSEKNAPYLGSVFIPTNATQTVQTYGSAKPEQGAQPTNTQEDSGYGLHFSKGGITAGCIAFGSQQEADRFAALSDKALNSQNGQSTLTVSKGK